MNEKAQKIVDKIKEVIVRKDVQPGYPDANGKTNTTWCNRGANYIATELGGDMTPFLDPRGINWTSANMMYQNALKNVLEITGSEAQWLANNGELILAACINVEGHGHVAIVCPSEDKYNNLLGPLVGETGWKCRITYAKEAFQRWGFHARYFIIQWREK